MSTVTISGTLILQGDLVCDGDINVTHTGKIIPVPTDEATEAPYNPDTLQYVYTNGRGSSITSTNGGINILGYIDGRYRGYGPNQGPGTNSDLQDSSGNDIVGYGATHAGLGAPPDGITVSPSPIYGSYEGPTSLGSGSGLVYGGGAVKLEAMSGTIAMNGVIDMNGQDGTGGETGGGSGGSAWLKAWDLDGTGAIYANGGSADGTFGGGAGGYVSLWYQRNNYSDMTTTAYGMKNAGDGKTFIKQMDPILEDRFTGHVLNTKWWQEVNGPMSLDNYVRFDTTNDFVNPEIRSYFTVSGKDITVDVDHVPIPTEPHFYSADLSLMIDSRNWLRVSKRLDQFVGRYALDGTVTEVSLHGYSYQPATLRINKTDSTFYFQFYDTTSSMQTIFSHVIEPFEDRTFKVSMSLQKLAGEVGEPIIEHFLLNSFNIANKYVSLAGPLTDPDNASLCVIEGTYQLYGLDFYVEGNRLKWDTSGLEAYDPPYTYPFTMHHILDATDVANKYVELYIPPELTGLDVHPDTVAVNISGGTTQKLGVDYGVYENKLIWGGHDLEPFMIEGVKLRIIYQLSPWVIDERLEDLFEVGDRIRVMYSADASGVHVAGAFDNLRVRNGILKDYQTLEPVLYVDATNGSDDGDGRPLTPLQNLFVATAWSKPGGVVVLYDGTHNSTFVHNKNLTIAGANGAKPLISTAGHWDATGSDWEYYALKFSQAQGVVKNVTLSGVNAGLRLEYSGNFQVVDSEITDGTAGISFVKSDPVMMRNEIHGVPTAIDLTSADDPYIYSNVIYDVGTAIRAGDCTTVTVQSNTIDDCTTAVKLDGSCNAIVASNNLTDCSVGVDVGYSSVKVYADNFYNTTTPYTGSPDTSANITADPLYVDKTGRDYHLQSGSPDIGTGLDTYDDYYIDFDGATRTHVSASDIGAYEFIDGTHSGPAWYVSTHGDDHWNFGGLYDPFRTLDKAESVADSTVWIDGGNYDTFYINLSDQSKEINELGVYIQGWRHAVSYITLSEYNINNKFVPFPGYVFDPDRTDYNIALNVLDKPVDGTRYASPSQYYGLDFEVQAGKITWNGLGMDGILAAGDTLRIIYFGELNFDAHSTLVLHPHYSNLNLNRAVYVSQEGSDSTVLGGDGTNSGGDGSLQRPFRTVERALQDSTAGDNIVVMSGAYPFFDGRKDRPLVPVYDKTSVINQDPRRYFEDLYWSDDFRQWNHIDYNDSWNFGFSGDSSALLSDGFINLTYDGINDTTAQSAFSFTGNFDVSVLLRNSVDPVTFAVHAPDNTAALQYNNGDYTSFFTAFVDSYCWGSITPTPMPGNDFLIEYIHVGADGSRNGYVNMSYNSADETSALNIVDGPPQERGVDYDLRGEQIYWRGMGLDGQVSASDMMRIIYRPTGLSDPVRARMIMTDGLLTIKLYDSSGWYTVGRKMLDADGTYSVSFSMDTTDSSRVGLYGKGYFSQFLTVADSFVDTDKDADYMVKTERKTVVFYE